MKTVELHRLYRELIIVKQSVKIFFKKNIRQLFPVDISWFSVFVKVKVVSGLN